MEYLRLNKGKIMKILIGITLSVSVLFSWSFEYKDIHKLTPKQKQVITESINVGNTKGLGLEVAAIAMVETQAGDYMGKVNRICGVHQVDTLVQLSKMKSKGSSKLLCKTLDNNHKYSALLATKELEYWISKSKNYQQAVNRYNRGWQPNKHDQTFWNRYNKAYTIIKQAVAKGDL